MPRQYRTTAAVAQVAAAPTARLCNPAHNGVMVTLRATVDADLDAVAAAEVDEDTRRWIGDTSREWHRAALADSDREHLVVLSEDDEGHEHDEGREAHSDHEGRIVGFAILAGLSDPHRSVELRRIVVATEHRGRGLGKKAFRAVVARAFEHGAHRVWLEVKETNHLAQELYANEGFSREGLLRETLREPDGSWSSFVLMSQLEAERHPSAL